jgi:hypothetical protein
VILEPEVESQMKTMYKNNTFYSTEHASHVTMSVVKLLARVSCAGYSPTEEEGQCYTEAIVSDALMQFAVVFSALIHNSDHTPARCQRSSRCKNVQLQERCREQFDCSSMGIL